MRTAGYGVTFLIALAPFLCEAQVGNEWVEANQQYFRVPVARDGIYKLEFSVLQSAGFPVTTVNPGQIQLFHRGVEQSIYVAGEGDGAFDATDYIEFFGQKNDGTLDGMLYQPPAAQPHSFHSLYSDTTAYFLTIGTSAGKRMSAFSAPSGGLTPEVSHADQKLLLLTTQYSAGTNYGDVELTTFDTGEGWTGNMILQGQSLDYVISQISQGATTVAQPTLEVLLVGRGNMSHAGEIFVGASQRLLTGFSFTGYNTHFISLPVQWSDIGGDGTLPVRVRVVGVGGQPDRFSTSYIILRYPQATDMAGQAEKVFRLNPNPGDSYITIENAPANVRLFDVTTPDEPIQVVATQSSTLNAVVASNGVSRKLLATSQTLSPTIRKVSFREIIPAQHDYLIIGHPSLRTPAGSYSDPIKAYAAYRASGEGGAYDTLVVNIQQLYDQFSYGESTPLAIYNFMKYMAGSGNPKYLLLVGKGLDVQYQYHRNPGAFTTYKDFVPSAGYPGADMVFTAGLSGTTHEPAVPTGRIPALKSEHVAAYLDKVKEMEALPYDALWRKDVLHLSGGINAGEPQLFRSFMQDFGEIAQDYHLGGNVSALSKYSTEIQHINVAEQVNRGLNLVTFFGHSSATTLDFEVGYVTDPVQGYNNKGKYPVLLMNGCNAGSFFLTYTLFGEDWLVARDRGASAFIAHSAYGFVSLLKKYTETFYSVGYQDSIYFTQGLGDIQKETARRLIDAESPTPAAITQAQQMVLVGDPAVRLFGAPKADLEINENNLSIDSFDGQPITALTDSFAIKMIVRNFGQTSPTSFRVEVLRTLNDNSTITYDSLYPAVKYSDTLTFVIRKDRESGFGNNTFQVRLDPDDVLPELTKANNVASKSMFIALNGTKNLFPINFAIVNTMTVGLSFQTSDVLSGAREFLVEIDTTITFDSPFRQQASISGTVLARVDFDLLSDQDTLVYYWRTKLAVPLPGETETWTQNSFTYIKDGPKGWAQVDFPQYLENQSEGLVKDSTLNRLRFLESETSISITTFGGSHPALVTDVSVKIANAEYNLYGPGYECRDNSINLIAFDRKSTVPYTAVKFEWFNRAGRNCGRKPWVINNYIPSQMVTGNNDDIIQYVDNVQPGDSVVIYSIGDAGYSLWPVAAKNKLGELGISVAQIDALTDGEPVIIFARKGAPAGAAKVIVAETSPANAQSLSVAGTITGGYSDGKMLSDRIGPATQWVNFYPRATEVEPTDAVGFDVWGIKADGSTELVLEDVNVTSDLTNLDANVYPYLRLSFNTGDDTNLSAAQLDHWLVIYEPVPEGILLYDGPREPVQLFEGQLWAGLYGFVNVSDQSFADSLTVAFEVFNHDSRTSLATDVRIKSPMPGDTSFFSLSAQTWNLAGLNDVNVFVNPRLEPEQYYDNNVVQLGSYLEVRRDVFRPVLDVTVDGRHLEEGDFVSPNPVIEARIWDENDFIQKKDTAGVRIFMTYPCGVAPCAPVAIPLNNHQITWKAATDTSAFTIMFTPNQLADGAYQLRVEGADAVGNASGLEPYVIGFEVKTESAVTISEPYPNPFSFAVHILVRLSGAVLPDEVILEVASVNGQAAYNINRQDLLPFHIGRNELTWDGTVNGNPLPGGVYTYRLMILVQGTQYVRMGKMVILR
jgi:hypothetical protein